jgi:hypothetical protein
MLRLSCNVMMFHLLSSFVVWKNICDNILDVALALALTKINSTMSTSRDITQQTVQSLCVSCCKRVLHHTIACQKDLSIWRERDVGTEGSATACRTAGPCMHAMEGKRAPKLNDF